MSFAKRVTKNLVIVENLIFVGAFVFIMYNLASTYGMYMYESVKGRGFLRTIIDPFLTHHYYISLVSVILLLNATFLLWEVLTLMIRLFKVGRSSGLRGSQQCRLFFSKAAVHYKSSFLAFLFNHLLPKLIMFHMFWIWLPHFQSLQLFTINLSWYSWIYGYLCWEFSSWLFHFSSHRVRFLWCLHSPHHAPSELNMTVNWIHFFAESYYSTLIRLLVLMLFGINTTMFAVVIAIDSAWGIFIHVGEDALRDGRLGILQHLIITPSHHRVHHAKNPLYLDTNFANVLPLWDWLLGTLQPIKQEVKTEYGIARELDVTNFSDLYFGELLLLYRDVKREDGLRNKLLYVFMPPGWTPVSRANTAAVLRQEFLKANPALGVTSKGKFFNFVRSRFGRYGLKTEIEELTGNKIVEIK